MTKQIGFKILFFGKHKGGYSLKTNIVLVGLYDKMIKSVAKRLADDFDMYLADLMEIVKYNLINEEEIEKICGVQYLNKQKTKIVEDIANYENSVIHVPYSIFVEGGNPDKFQKNGTTVFLNLTLSTFKKLLDKDKTMSNDEKKLALIAFNDRSSFSKRMCDLTVEIDSPDYLTAYRKVKKTLDNFLL